MNQRELAHRTGLSLTTISYIDSGKRFPQKETQKKIAAIFRVEPDIIFDRVKPIVPLLPPIERERLPINCRRCGIRITGLMWNPQQCELIVKNMPRLAKVHTNGFFYHEDCLNEKIRIHKAFPFLSEK